MRIRTEPDWYAAVARNIAPWLGRVVDVRNAVLTNALDAKRPPDDQRMWMQLYGQMVGEPDLIPDKDD